MKAAVVSAAGQDSLELPAAALRSSAILLMGSGLKSVPMPKLLEGIGHIFAIAGPARLQIPVTEAPLARVGELWEAAPGNPRLVFTLP